MDCVPSTKLAGAINSEYEMICHTATEHQSLSELTKHKTFSLLSFGIFRWRDHIQHLPQQEHVKADNDRVEHVKNLYN